METLGKKVEEISIDLLDAPTRDMRQVMSREKLEDLAASIARYGVLEPILVRQDGGRYEIKAGNRRFEAAKMAGKVTIPAIVLDGPVGEDDAITLEENVLREDVDPVSIARYIQLIMKERGYTAIMCAEKFGKSREWVNYHLRLIDLPANVKQAVEGGVIAVQSALLLGEIGDEKYRDWMLEQAVVTGATIRVVRNWILGWKNDETLRAKIQAGDYVVPPAIPPMPMMGECWLCGERYQSETMISLRVDTGCWDWLVGVRKLYRSDQRTEGGNNGQPDGQTGGAGEHI
jgi:ParB/RepB/Spo0J family partition protein